MNTQRRAAKIAVFVGVLLASSTRYSHACLWDRDTLADEQRGLPEITAIIVGRYERHTPEYYERRIRLASADLKTAKPENAKLLLDDIAVAQDRLDRQDQAIATMETKIARYGVDYRTAANLGTFYAHQKKWPQAETWIRRALNINSDAHFGREWVQLEAIQFFRSRKTLKPDNSSWLFPFWNDTVGYLSDPSMPVSVVRDLKALEQEIIKSGIKKDAVDATAALIKMGDRDSPEMFGALAQILGAHGHSSLSAMAYWRAAELTPQESPWRKYWGDCGTQMVKRLQSRQPTFLEKQYGKNLAKYADFLPRDFSKWGQIQVVAEYAGQRRYAKQWRDAFQLHEKQLMQSGKNPEDIANFATFYAQWGTPQTAHSLETSGSLQFILSQSWIMPLLVGLMFSAYLVVRRKRVKADRT